MAGHNKPYHPSSNEADRIANLEYHRSRMRKCHDCGELTTNYRCAECLVKWKARHGVSSTVSDS